MIHVLWNINIGQLLATVLTKSLQTGRSSAAAPIGAALLCWLSLLCLADNFRETHRTCLWSFVVISFHLTCKKTLKFVPNLGILWRFVLINRICPTLILEFTTAGGGKFIAPIRAVAFAIAEPALGDAAVGAGAAEEPRSTRHWACGGAKRAIIVTF